jgi:excisionase family DNA binding protein
MAPQQSGQTTANWVQNDSRDRLALGVHDVCRLTGLGRTTIYATIKAGDLVARKLGRRTVILAADLEVFLAKLPPIGAKVTEPPQS